MTAKILPASTSMMASVSHSNGRESQWFDSERFLDPNFNAEQYVADLRRYVSSEASSLHIPCFTSVGLSLSHKTLTMIMHRATS